MKRYLKKLMGFACEDESHIDNIFNIISKHLPFFHPANLLDVGCGNGGRTIRLAQYFNIDAGQIYGIDFHEPYLQQCMNQFNAVQADIESGNLPYSNDMFDLVICNQVLEHLKDFHSILYDIVRVTKPGGYIIIGIPNLAHLINRFYLLFGIQPMCIALQSPHVRGFTHKAFEQILQLTPGITYMACAGSKLIYPLPLPLAIPLSKVCIGICAYTCYLVRKS